jgi:hypothetical protein
MNDQEYELGSMQFAHPKGEYNHLIQYDRLAVGPTGHLLFASIVADHGLVKAVRACLGTNGTPPTILATGGRVAKPKGVSRNPGKLAASPDKYRVEWAKLDPTAAHAVLIAKSPGLLLNTGDEAIWQELNDSRFTTPILRSWVPYIARELRRLDLLQEAECYRCEVGLLVATTADLDKIVVNGVRDGVLPVAAEPVA